MAIKIKMELTSKIKQYEHTNTLVKKYNGEYKIINDVHYIRVNDEIMGKMTLKFDITSNKLVCLWEKHVIKRIVFDLNTSTIMDYELPHGRMTFNVTTTKLMYSIQKQYVTNIQLNYKLKQANQLFGSYKQNYKIVM